MPAFRERRIGVVQIDGVAARQAVRLRPGVGEAARRERRVAGAGGEASLDEVGDPGRPAAARVRHLGVAVAAAVERSSPNADAHRMAETAR